MVGGLISVGAVRNLSADMLLYVLSPLSKRGRFLVPEESASSMRSLCVRVGPVDVARFGVKGETVKTESMTLCFAKYPGPKSGQGWKATVTRRAL